LAALSIPTNPKGYLELERWARYEEIIAHDKELERLVTERAPDLMASHGIAILTVAEMLIIVGEDPTRIHWQAEFVKLCGVCPIPAFSGKTHRFRLNRGGNPQANAAFYRLAIVRTRSHEPTLAYVKKRTKDGKSKSEINRCLKRDIVREIYSQLCVAKIAQIAAWRIQELQCRRRDILQMQQSWTDLAAAAVNAATGWEGDLRIHKRVL
jgi:hypothetical protein